MAGNLEILLGGPAQGATLMGLAERASAERSAAMTKPQREALRRLLVDAAAGRAYLALVKGREAGHVIVTFGVSVRAGGRVAVIEDFYIAAEHRERGFEARILSAVLRDLAAFGLVEASLVAPPDGRGTQVALSTGFTLSGDRLFRIALEDPGEDD